MKIRRKRYVHYGQNEFDPLKYDRGSSDLSYMNKPDNGMWGSPVQGYFTWKDFCKREDFRTESLNSRFYFRLSANARILKVRKLKDVIKYLVETGEKSRLYRYRLDFNKIMKHYDGMELTHSRKTYHELHCWLFNSWDVDSIVVWNSNCIIPDTR